MHNSSKQSHMLEKPQTVINLTVVLLICGFSSGCIRTASTAPTALPSFSAPNPSLIIVEVQVTQDTGVYVRGETNLPDGNCIQTELRAGEQVEPWWPEDICIEVASGQWEILVPLGRRGAPSELNNDVQYVVHAWWPQNPQAANTTFPFDLSGPAE